MEIQSPDRQLRLAVDLVNTRTREPEQLTSPADLRSFLLEHGEPDSIELGQEDLIAVRQVRERIRPVFHESAGDAARAINELLAEYAVPPYLSDHDGTPWHLHVARPEGSWAEWLAATAGLGLATFVGGHGFAALGVCAAADCERVFANAAVRRPRRFCTPTCASRTRVAAHRARRL